MIEVLNNPTQDQLGRTPDEFLALLQKPTLIKVAGKNTTRTRAVATLLHGNEPSGFFAIHRWLRLQETPPVNFLFFVGNVWAAKLIPCFYNRQLPDGRDLNRCFKPPFDGIEGQVANTLLEIMHKIQPEALIDIHNTSGTGPSFAVTIKKDKNHLALSALFTERLMYTQLRLGALMEYSERDVPTVTVECGGAQDEHAHLCAWEGLLRYIHADDVFKQQQTDWELEVLTNPVRVEILPDVTLTYSNEPDPKEDITLRPDIEHFNFGTIQTDVTLGWVGSKGLNCFRIIDSNGRDIRDQVLRIENGVLKPAQAIKAFMITANYGIAKSDCLMYVVTDKGEQILSQRDNS